MYTRAAALNLGIIFIALTVASLADASELKYMKVVQVRGEARSKISGVRDWAPLGQGFVRNGEAIAAGSKSEVNIALDDKFNSMLKVGNESHISALNPPRKIYIQKGDLFVLREEDIEKERMRRDTLDILTKDGLIQVGTGGFIISAEGKGTAVYAFGEQALVFPFARPNETPERIILEEGMKLTMQKNGQVTQKRIIFEDFGRWQAWVRQMYELKDDLAANVLWSK